MRATNLVTPDRYHWVAKELQCVVKEIETAIFDRPVPAGFPRPLREAWGLLTRVQEVVTKIQLSANGLTSDVLCNKAATITKARQSVAAVGDGIQELKAIYHDLWERPLPSDMAGAQAYFAAIPETLLKRCHLLFRNFIGLVSLEPDAWGAQTRPDVHLRLNLDVREEIHRLQSWFSKAKTSHAGAPCLEWLAAGFVLGLWID